MALWLVRGGGHGEFEQRFLGDGRVYLTWSGLHRDLRDCSDREEIRTILEGGNPTGSPGKIRNHASQIWAFVDKMSVGDWCVLPSKHKSAVHIGEIKGAYEYDGSADDRFQHRRKVEWLATDIPRSNFDQDILYSFGAMMTICQIKRNDAEERVRKMASQGWKAGRTISPVVPTDDGDDEQAAAVDLELVARDQLVRTIAAKYMGHGLARLVAAILEAQGYTTHTSPPGPDKGIDILAGAGPLGFGQPRICVQVKSGDSPLDRPTLDQLIGTMQNVQADQGLLVSWGGFKSSVEKEKAAQFFRVRLWDQDRLVEQLLEYYERLDDDLRAELPLKRIWVVASPDGEDGDGGE